MTDWIHYTLVVKFTLLIANTLIVGTQDRNKSMHKIIMLHVYIINVEDGNEFYPVLHMYVRIVCTYVRSYYISTMHRGGGET